ncbi:MAG: hypothetical protein N7Q72_07365, partial [Spiroplasma sp. Tabriz.8]|nr:hypothetical protein [Spiroplasma sp. Tabriz.8]
MSSWICISVFIITIIISIIIIIIIIIIRIIIILKDECFTNFFLLAVKQLPLYTTVFVCVVACP